MGCLLRVFLFARSGRRATKRCSDVKYEHSWDPHDALGWAILPIPLHLFLQCVLRLVRLEDTKNKLFKRRG